RSRVRPRPALRRSSEATDGARRAAHPRPRRGRGAWCHRRAAPAGGQRTRRPGLAPRPPHRARCPAGVRQPRRHLYGGRFRDGAGAVHRLGHAVRHAGVAPGPGRRLRGLRGLPPRERRQTGSRAAVRRLRPGLRPGDRAPAGARGFEGDRLPPRGQGRYTTARAGGGVRRAGRAVLQCEHPGRPGAGGGGVAATRMISIIGRKDAGKTTVLVALAGELVRRKLRVMTIKHGTHPADTDQRGKDSWRHWHEGHAERVLMEGPGQRVLWERTEHESDPIALARRYLEGAEIVLVEGFKDAPLPKIEVYRLAAGPEPLFDPAVHDPGDWVAMVTAHAKYRADFPGFRFSDTAWPVTIANLARARAQVLPPRPASPDRSR